MQLVNNTGKLMPITLLMEHAVAQATELYKDTDHAGTFHLFHDALSTWWEPLSQTYLSAIFDIDRQLRCYGDTNEGTRYYRTLVGDSPELCVSLDAFGFADLKCAVVYNAALSSVYGIDDPRRFNLGTPRQVFDSLRRAWEVAPTSERICEDIERLPHVLKVRDMPLGPHAQHM